MKEVTSYIVLQRCDGDPMLIQTPTQEKGTDTTAWSMHGTWEPRKM